MWAYFTRSCWNYYNCHHGLVGHVCFSVPLPKPGTGPCGCATPLGKENTLHMSVTPPCNDIETTTLTVLRIWPHTAKVLYKHFSPDAIWLSQVFNGGCLALCLRLSLSLLFLSFLGDLHLFRALKWKGCWQLAYPNGFYHDEVETVLSYLREKYNTSETTRDVQLLKESKQKPSC